MATSSLSSRPGNTVLPALLAVVALGGVAGGWWYLSQKTTPAVPPVARGPVLANSLGMLFAPIPKGTFLMGSPNTEAERGADEAQHEVVITQDFHLGANEVTQAQFQKIMGENPSYFTPTGPGKAKVRVKETGQSPVECVTWHQAVEFCKKLARPATRRRPGQAPLPPADRGGMGVRLPGRHDDARSTCGDAVDSYSRPTSTACRPTARGRGGPFLADDLAGRLVPPNAFGLYDMHGNVLEWCQDWYAADYYAKSPKEDPPGPASGTEKVTRGGSWSNSGKACRSAVRTEAGAGRVA